MKGAPSRALWLASAAAAMILFGAAQPAAATAGDDFAPASDAWNALGYLSATAAEANVKLEIRAALDWADLHERQILFVIAPKAGLSGEMRRQLSAFLAAGGRLIVADDFRAGDSWVRPFGLRFSDRPGPVAGHDADRRYLPVLKAVEEPELADRPAPMNRFLGFEVSQVVLNHPAALIHGSVAQQGWRHVNRGPYLDGVRAWLVEAIGPAGRVLAIADSSLFINSMLTRYRGNKQFAANVMRYYCVEGRPCEVVLLANLSELAGTFHPRGAEEVGPGRRRGDVREMIARAFDRLARTLRSPLLRPLWWLGALLCLAIPVVFMARLPAPLLPPRAESDGATSVLFETVRAWLARPGADYRRPARQLALQLARLVSMAGQRGDDRPDKSQQTPTLNELPEAIAALVEGGQLGGQAGQRLNDVVMALRKATAGDLIEVDRQRFTQLAAEVEWAEHVLSHTGGAG